VALKGEKEGRERIGQGLRVNLMGYINRERTWRALVRGDLRGKRLNFS